MSPYVALDVPSSWSGFPVLSPQDEGRTGMWTNRTLARAVAPVTISPQGNTDSVDFVIGHLRLCQIRRISE